MSAAMLLDRLAVVRSTGPGRYIARCPAHEDKSPSLSIRALDDGRVLVKCFAGCETGAVLDAVGLDFSALFPERLGEFKRERHPFPAADVLRCLAFEAMVVRCAAAAMREGEVLSDVDYERLGVAVERLDAGMLGAGL